MSRAAVTVSHRSGYAHQVTARDHETLLDEPVELGGTDEGLSPWEYVLAGMGGCTAVTVEMYAQRKGWPLDGVEVTLAREQDGSIDITVDVFGTLDDAQRARLVAVAGHCPVVRAVSDGIEVREQVTVHAS